MMTRTPVTTNIMRGVKNVDCNVQFEIAAYPVCGYLSNFPTILYRTDVESRRAVSPTTTVTSPLAAAGAPDAHGGGLHSVTESSGRIFPCRPLVSPIDSATSHYGQSGRPSSQREGEGGSGGGGGCLVLPRYLKLCRRGRWGGHQGVRRPQGALRCVCGGGSLAECHHQNPFQLPQGR